MSNEESILSKITYSSQGLRKESVHTSAITTDPVQYHNVGLKEWLQKNVTESLLLTCSM